MEQFFPSVYHAMMTDNIHNPYHAEAQARWGNSEAYKESVARTGRMSKSDMALIQAKSDALLNDIVAHMKQGPGSSEVQQLIAQHYNGLRAFYEPNLTLYRGLADMYVDDPRFVAYFAKYHVNLPRFMREAMYAYADTQEETTVA